MSRAIRHLWPRFLWPAWACAGGVAGMWIGGSRSPFGLMIGVVDVGVIMLSIESFRNSRRARSWECWKCRYDRRGLAVGSVCPECGALPQAPPNRS